MEIMDRFADTDNDSEKAKDLGGITGVVGVLQIH